MPIQYKKPSNYLLAVLFMLLAAFNIMQGWNPAETIILFSAIATFLILINSNQLFSAVLKGKKIRKYYVQSLKSHYFEILTTSVAILLFVSAYFIYAYSDLASNLLTILGVLIVSTIPYLIKKKKAAMLKAKKGDLTRSSILAHYFILPVLTGWYVVVMLIAAKLYLFVAFVMLYIVGSMIAGYIKLRIYGN
ncbi:MAG: hypothetical protein ACQESG_02615 [Nanobdellota archaeon]